MSSDPRLSALASPQSNNEKFEYTSVAGMLELVSVWELFGMRTIFLIIGDEIFAECL